MEASRAEVIGIGSEAELTVPGFVERNASADQRNRELLAAYEEDFRHNGEIDREANPDDWVDPVSAKKIFANWNRSVDAVPLIERLEATGQLDLAMAAKKPEWVDEATIHEALRALAVDMLDGEKEVEAVHPRSQVRYQLSPEELPLRRLAIALAQLEEVRVGDSTLIRKQAFVYDPSRRRFLSHVIYREVGPHSLESRLDMGFKSDINEDEHSAELIDLVSNLRVLAESGIVLVERQEAA